MAETLSIKVSSEDKARLKVLAAARNVPISELIREGLHKVLSETGDSERPSCYELFAKDLEQLWAGDGSGITDLSTNKEHMEGFGES
ncbi:CopG family transcriptional regulator [Haloferula rosea]|uniref:CopG family transcriptional regulator n=1 Tax=Haloferula rosea TaxID=490093 RepID=A0A934VFA3_9BACT|nr:CopG family transcriptional regulator [Haloferula rosea]MBK1826787.1 CopG family transcriptional regulator [Haloferula rosea]